MLVFNEGLPRSGKSYDAVLDHILVALRAGRRVFARINGLNVDAIAQYLSMEPGRVAELLTLVSSPDVRKLFCAYRDSQGEWAIASELKDALFVVDECHEFYVADRAPINPAVENFFALCGQNGMDGVLMSQWYKRLHSSLRARIERKNVFQKLTAVGMQKKYTVRRFHALGPDRFELIGTETKSYDPAIFPLYKGYADGADNTAVYTAGGKTVWAKLRIYALFVFPLVAAGVWSFHSFFGSRSSLVPRATQAQPAPTVGPLSAASVQQTFHQPPGPAPLDRGMIRNIDTKGMPSGVAYVFDLGDHARARLAGIVQGYGLPRGVIEWVQDGGKVLDRLSFDQVRDLGVAIEVHKFGVRLVYQKHDLIVTSWPLDVPPPESSAAPSSSAAASPSVSSATASVASATPWPNGGIDHDYIPPQLVPHVALSNWKPAR